MKHPPVTHCKAQPFCGSHLQVRHQECYFQYHFLESCHTGDPISIPKLEMNELTQKEISIYEIITSPNDKQEQGDLSLAEILSIVSVLL